MDRTIERKKRKERKQPSRGNQSNNRRRRRQQPLEGKDSNTRRMRPTRWMSVDLVMTLLKQD